MSKCLEIYKKYSSGSQYSATGYIDPDGYEYDTVSVVTCAGCVFNNGAEVCILYQELGLSDIKIINKIRMVYETNYCDYFLMIGGFPEDEKVMSEVQNIGYISCISNDSGINSGVSNKKSSCFVATEVYGSVNSQEVVVLRKYRDKILLKNGVVGTFFVSFYYKVGPYLALFLRNFPILKVYTKFIFDIISKRCERKLCKLNKE